MPMVSGDLKFPLLRAGPCGRSYRRILNRLARRRFGQARLLRRRRARRRLDRMRQEDHHPLRQRLQRRHPCRHRLHLDRPARQQSHDGQSREGGAGARLARRLACRRREIRPDRSLSDQFQRHQRARARPLPAPKCSARTSPTPCWSMSTSPRRSSAAPTSPVQTLPAQNSRSPISRAPTSARRSSAHRSTSRTPSLFLTRIEGLDLSAATGLAQWQIDMSCGDGNTKLPCRPRAVVELALRVRLTQLTTVITEIRSDRKEPARRAAFGSINPPDRRHVAPPAGMHDRTAVRVRCVSVASAEPSVFQSRP